MHRESEKTVIPFGDSVSRIVRELHEHAQSVWDRGVRYGPWNKEASDRLIESAKQFQQLADRIEAVAITVGHNAKLEKRFRSRMSETEKTCARFKDGDRVTYWQDGRKRQGTILKAYANALMVDNDRDHPESTNVYWPDPNTVQHVDLPATQSRPAVPDIEEATEPIVEPRQQETSEHHYRHAWAWHLAEGTRELLLQAAADIERLTAEVERLDTAEDGYLFTLGTIQLRTNDALHRGWDPVEALRHIVALVQERMPSEAPASGEGSES